MKHDVDKKLALAVDLHIQNRTMDAEAIYIDILNGDANHYQALLCLGLLYGDIQHFEKAVALFEQAALAYPRSIEIHHNLALMLFNVKRYEDAIIVIKNVLILQPEHFGALHLLGLIAYAKKQYEEAQSYLDAALLIEPNNISLINNFGIVLRALKKYDESLAIYERALILAPDEDNLLYNKFTVLYELKHYIDALECVEKILIKTPNNVKILECKASTCAKLNRINETIVCWEKIVTLDSENSHTRSNLLYELMCNCDWNDTPLHIEAIRFAAEHPILTERDKILPLIGHALPGLTSKEHYNLSHRYAIHLSKEMSALKQKLSFSYSKQAKKKIKIGYFSLDFRIHPLAQLIPEVLELHDREHFVIYAYSYGPNDKSVLRKRIEAAVDYFLDVEFFDDESVVKKINSDQIDILIDLTGYSWVSRTKLLALRPAPIQVSYLGYLGTMGADFIDALIADKFVIPPKDKHYYTEKVYYLPCYQANDRQCAISVKPSRAFCGLPEEALVFCCFNQTFKISPKIFNVWCELLQQVPNSVLWLLASNKNAVENLREQLQLRDINPDRIVFANVIPLDEHLARLQCADIMLDTHSYNAGTTASNALWAGVPVVTYSGETFPSRMAGSLLTALGVPELITYNLDDYYQLALMLATNHEKRHAIADKIKANRETAILFNTPFLVKSLEKIYEQMWKDYMSI